MRLLSIWLIFLMLFGVSSAMFSCSPSYTRDEWFSEEKLDAAFCADLPAPEGVSWLYDGDSTVYTYLNNVQYKDYVQTVCDYLCAQDYTYLGTRGAQKSTLAGLFTTYYFRPTNVLSEFENEYGMGYTFVYNDGSMDESEKPVLAELQIERVDTDTMKIDGETFSYNTVIRLDSDSDRYVIKATKIVYSEELYELLLDGYRPTQAYPGQEVVLRTLPIMDADLKIYWDKYTPVRQTHADSDYWEYRFKVYGETDIELSCKIVGGVLAQRKLTEFEPWLNRLNVSQIERVETVFEYVGVAPGRLKDVCITYDEQAISDLLAAYGALSLREIPPEDGAICGGSALSVIFYTGDGKTYTLYFNNDNYQTSSSIYRAESLPTIANTAQVTHANRFIVINGEAQVFNAAGEAVGTIDNIGDMTFVDYPDGLFTFPEGYTHTVQTEFGTLFVYSDTVFSYNDRFYQCIMHDE